jgi:hypothetical protein
MSRILRYVPMVHHPEETGLKGNYTNRRWAELCQKIEPPLNAYWDIIDAKIAQIPFENYSGTRVYVDALVRSEKGLSAKEEYFLNNVYPIGWNRVKTSAKKGLRTSKTVMDILRRGGILEGTENKEYLSSIYKQKGNARIRATAKSLNPLENLLGLRDQYIAKVIDATLLPGEQGFLFIGLDPGTTNLAPDIYLEPIIAREEGKYLFRQMAYDIKSTKTI